MCVCVSKDKLISDILLCDLMMMCMLCVCIYIYIYEYIC